MNKSIFEVKSENGQSFLCNRDDGRWVIAKDLDEGSKNLSKTHSLCNSFNGTSMIVLNVTRLCNLDCIYCFAGDIRKDLKMSYEVGKKAIDRVLELPESDRRIVFHGNEPMTNFNLIRDLVEYSKQRGKINFCMQSNGTLFNEENIDYLVSNNVGIGISLDGLERHQNISRPYLGGKGSFNEVVKNIKKIKSLQGSLSVVSVVSKFNVGNLEEITQGFENLGISSVCFNPAYPYSRNSDFVPNQQILANNMIKLFDNEIEKVAAGKLGISVTNLTDLLRTFFIPKNTYNCARCSGSSVHPLIGIDIDGSIYPCDLFWGRENFKIGDITNMSLVESFNSSKNFRVYRTLANEKDCLDCNWKVFCGGECPGVSIRCDGAIASKGFYCDYRKAILDYASKKLPVLHQRGVLGKLLKV